MKVQKKVRQHMLAMRRQLAEKGLIAVRDAAKVVGVPSVRTDGLKAVKMGTLRMISWVEFAKRYPKELNLPATAVEALARALA